MNPYTVFSQYYDKLNYDCDYDKWSQYLYFLLQKYSVKKDAAGADAACGSGLLTIKLNKAGLNLYGFDISESMLNAAKGNAAKSGEKIEFLSGDLLTFKAHKKLGFITCSCDGVNYIEKNNLGRCFKNLYNNLSSGGVLLFDISSACKLENIIGNNTFSDDTKNVTYIWNNSLDKSGFVQMDLIFFVKEGSLYRRFDETHIQYIHKEEDIKKELLAAGFKTVDSYNFLTTDASQGGCKRIQFAAVK